MQFRLALIALAQLAFSAVATANSGALLGEVITMLKNLEAKTVEEGKDEDQLHDKYMHWSTNEQKAFTAQINKDTESVKVKTVQLSEQTSINAASKAEFDQLSKEHAQLMTDMSAADRLRSDTESAYQKKSGDLDATIKAVQNALQQLQVAYDQGQNSFLQTKALEAPLEQALAILHAFRMNLDTETAEGLNRRTSTASAGPPIKARGNLREHTLTEGASNARNKGLMKVIEMLKKLEGNLDKELTQATTEETNSMNAYELARTANVNQEAALTKQIGEASTASGASALKMKELGGEIKLLNSDIARDKQALSDVQTTTDSSVAQYNQRVADRKAEQAAINKAIEIIGGAVGVQEQQGEQIATPAPPKLLQAALSFLQSKPRADVFLALDDPRLKVVQLIRDEARVSKSHAFDRLAQEVCAQLERGSEGKFAQIINQIEKMKFVLKNEQRSEDDHKAWCDKERDTTNIEFDDTDATVNELTATINKLASDISILTHDIKETDQSIANKNEYLQELEDIRDQMKKENAQALKDTKKGEVALQQAIEVLRKYEASIKSDNAGAASSDAVSGGATFEQDYEGMGARSNVIGYLENIAQSFAQESASIERNEAADEVAFKNQVSEQTIAISGLEQEAKGMRRKRDNAKAEKASAESKKKEADKELDDLRKYKQELIKPCGTGDDTDYNARKAARNSEIDALECAKAILQDAPNKNEVCQQPSFLQSAPSKKVSVASVCA